MTLGVENAIFTNWLTDIRIIHTNPVFKRPSLQHGSFRYDCFFTVRYILRIVKGIPLVILHILNHLILGVIESNFPLSAKRIVFIVVKLIGLSILIDISDNRRIFIGAHGSLHCLLRIKGAAGYLNLITVDRQISQTVGPYKRALADIVCGCRQNNCLQIITVFKTVFRNYRQSCRIVVAKIHRRQIVAILKRARLDGADALHVRIRRQTYNRRSGLCLSSSCRQALLNGQGTVCIFRVYNAVLRGIVVVIAHRNHLITASEWRGADIRTCGAKIYRQKLLTAVKRIIRQILHAFHGDRLNQVITTFIFLTIVRAQSIVIIAAEQTRNRFCGAVGILSGRARIHTINIRIQLTLQINCRIVLIALRIVNETINVYGFHTFRHNNIMHCIQQTNFLRRQLWITGICAAHLERMSRIIGFRRIRCIRHNRLKQEICNSCSSSAAAIATASRGAAARAVTTGCSPA